MLNVICYKFRRFRDASKFISIISIYLLTSFVCIDDDLVLFVTVRRHFTNETVQEAQLLLRQLALR